MPGMNMVIRPTELLRLLPKQLGILVSRSYLRLTRTLAREEQHVSSDQPLTNLVNSQALLSSDYFS